MAVASRRTGRRRSMSQINVVPFIDVMLVLLIIFMVTAPLLQQGVEVDLPEADAQPLQDETSQREAIVVTVTRDGQLSLNQGPQVGVPLDRETLREIVAGLLGQHPQTQVYVRGDRFVDYGQVVDAMVSVQSAGAQRVGLITDPPDVSARDR
ncbi:protein TolR [Ectothiorhodospira lacustris]|uniref:protein TolR n=1 Tax=Ectothiorhodospira lacustris TaxID=2899127 RepID=UPI001EE97B35|nr:protein TolR [Ectothiorhodospira lacustris]MCG5500919.1 protein TolR [Ectothiorhodospira lacustris]MCG5510598.1 protein TolR [Ectothiorhodospira lacustris]MCG5521290.1 protein TolR [Ectothiorhodospira lacustris]